MVMRLELQDVLVLLLLILDVNEDGVADLMNDFASSRTSFPYEPLEVFASVTRRVFYVEPDNEKYNLAMNRF